MGSNTDINRIYPGRIYEEVDKSNYRDICNRINHIEKILAGNLGAFNCLPTFGFTMNNIITLTVGSGTYTPTSGTRAIYVIAQGAGGGGGGATYAAGQPGVGGGGSAGGYCEKLITSLSTSYSYVVGAKGTGGSAGNNNGNNGSNTTFSSILTANGGNGGGGGEAYSPVTWVSNGLGGGFATGGDINRYGGRAGICLVASTSGGGGGNGGASPFGYGGNGGQNGADGTSPPAYAYGAGGGGACAIPSTNKSGGNGVDGVIIIYEFI